MKKVNLLPMLFLALPFTAICQQISGDNSNKFIKQDRPQLKPLPLVNWEEWESGSTTPGDHTQHMLSLAYCESDPDRIYMGQDVDNVWVSRDFGKNWFTIANEGLLSPFVISIEVDPLDKNRVIAAVQCRHYDQVNQPNQGIYLSENGGVSWKKTASRTVLGEVRSNTKLIAYAPGSKDNKQGLTKLWYAAFGEYRAEKGNKTLRADDGLLFSKDGGLTWSEIRKLPASLFGSTIRGIKVHVSNADCVYIYGNGGLFKLEEATNPNGIVTKISGNNGLPDGDIWGSLYQSADGKTLVLAVSQKGVYKSVNSGKSWNLIYDWDKVNYCFVNEKFPDKIFAVPVEKGGYQLRITDNGGKSWYEPDTVIYRAGYDYNAWTHKLGGQFAYVLPDPRDPNKVFIHSKSKNFRSEDGGKTWYPSDNGFNGTQHTGINSEQMFDPKNPNRFCYFMIDRGTAYTDSRGRWFYNNTIEPKNLNLTWKSVTGGALHPTLPIILASAGSGANGKLVRSADNGKTWTVVCDSNQSRWVVAFDLQDPNYCYQWRERSSDAGLTWTELPNLPQGAVICGVSRSNGRVLYAMDIDASKKKVWRSKDRGDSWELVIEATWDLTFPGPNEMFIFRVDPLNPDMVYTSSASGHFTKWDLHKMPVKSVEIKVTDKNQDNFFLNRLAIDPRYPQVLYALNQRANTGYTFFRSIDGGATWMNISKYISQGSVNGLSVSPVTGEVYVSGQNGSQVMLPPYKTSNTAYEVVPYTNNHIGETYD